MFFTIYILSKFEGGALTIISSKIAGSCLKVWRVKEWVEYKGGKRRVCPHDDWNKFASQPSCLNEPPRVHLLSQSHIFLNQGIIHSCNKLGCCITSFASDETWTVVFQNIIK